MIRKLILFSGLIFGSEALSFNDSALDTLRDIVAGARSGKSFEEASRREATYLGNLRACEFEINSGVPPIHCFSVLLEREKLGLLESVLFNHRRKHLEVLCQKSAQKIRNWRLLKAKLSILKGSKICELALRERISDLEYQSIGATQDNSIGYQDIGPVHSSLQ